MRRSQRWRRRDRRHEPPMQRRPGAQRRQWHALLQRDQRLRPLLRHVGEFHSLPAAAQYFDDVPAVRVARKALAKQMGTLMMSQWNH